MATKDKDGKLTFETTSSKDQDGKLTFQMTSPGQAWMNFVNGKDGHNAAAVTPSYLADAQKNPDLSRRISEKKKEMEQQKAQTVEPNQAQTKDQNSDRGRG